jgi:hypothetical protein
MSLPLWPYGGMQATVSSRHGLNPDHNIWNNNGTWWCHFTVHDPDHTKERVRVSLGTKDREEARRQRDFIMSGTAAIAARLPHRQSQATPAPPTVCASPLPRKAPKHWSSAAKHGKLGLRPAPCESGSGISTRQHDDFTPC